MSSVSHNGAGLVESFINITLFRRLARRTHDYFRRQPVAGPFIDLDDGDDLLTSAHRNFLQCAAPCPLQALPPETEQPGSVPAKRQFGTFIR
jgi:hypothetical protein